MKKKRLILLCFIILINLLSLPVFGEGAGELQTEYKPLVIKAAALKGPSGIGMIHLFEEPPESDENVAFSFSVASSPDILVSQILKKEVDIASLPLNVAANLYTKGTDYILGAVTGYGLLYCVTSRDDISSIRDLAGKTVYSVGKGATPEYVFAFLLEQEGLVPGQDCIINYSMNQIELTKILIAGKRDTALLPEPFVTMVLKGNTDFSIALDLQKEWQRHFNQQGSYPMTCVVIRKGLYGEQPGGVGDFLSGYKKSIQWVQKNPGEAEALTEKYNLGMPADIAASVIPRLNLTFLPAREARAEVEIFLKVLFNFAPKSIGGALPDGGFYGQE